MNSQYATQCQACGHQPIDIFHTVKGIPSQSVLLFRTRQEALEMPRGDLILGFCPECGFIGNQAFNPSLLEYSSRYEETQGFSATFVKFHTDLAKRLIDVFDLRGKKILEIGSGKGEFLTLLCELGNNNGVGFDPVYDEKRTTSSARDRMTFVKDFYSEKYADVQADMVCCKMTLEHIATPLDFLQMIRRTLGGRHDIRVFFQVPEVTGILRAGAFWDMYYEHCSYFTPVSLEGVFRRAGFAVNNVWAEYDDQYLMIDAVPGDEDHENRAWRTSQTVQDVRDAVDRFKRDVKARIETMNALVEERARRGQRMVIWGAGSKGVGFLTSLRQNEVIRYAVDVNPHKYGTFMAGTAQEIVPPGFLSSYQPHVVFVMNPIYLNEIGASLREVGVTAELIPLGE